MSPARASRLMLRNHIFEITEVRRLSCFDAYGSTSWTECRKAANTTVNSYEQAAGNDYGEVKIVI